MKSRHEGTYHYLSVRPDDLLPLGLDRRANLRRELARGVAQQCFHVGRVVLLVRRSYALTFLQNRAVHGGVRLTLRLDLGGGFSILRRARGK